MTDSFMKLAVIPMLVILAACSGRDTADERIVSIKSPDGKNVITLERSVTGARNILKYAVRRDGRPVVQSSALQITMAGKGPMTEGVRIHEVKEDRVDETFSMPWGKAGEFVVLARRKGTTWYLGGMTNNTGREIAVPLHILDPGEYEAELLVDGSPSGEEPNAIRLERQAVTAETSLEITMAPGGGFAAAIRPKSEGFRLCP